jgi:UDP-glucose 4-epimerase
MIIALHLHALTSSQGDSHVNVLVTGAAGYIGSICSELLVSSGIKVVAVDNLCEGSRSAVPSQASFYQADFGDSARLDEIFQHHQIDAVMHFAGEALVEKSMKDPSAFYVTNIARGIFLLDAMLRHRVNNFILSSTCAVYGEPAVVPIPEDHPTSPVNPYGKSKLIFENILADYHKYAGLNYVSLRYFNVAGASRDRGECRRHETHLIPLALHAVQAGHSHIHVFGTDYPTPDGTCIRDYIHVLDIAQAHFLALENISRIAGNAFNVGTGAGHSIREVLDAVRLVTGSKIPEKAFSRRLGDPAVLVASGEKMRRELGWLPAHSSLAEIVKSAWLWKQSHPQGYVSDPKPATDSLLASTP